MKRLGIITPYMPVGDRQVRRFFTDCGYEVIGRVNRGSVDAVVQVGTNLAMAAVAADAERRLGKPVIAINAATYWYALRQYGIKDKVVGWGSLLSEH